MTASTNEGYDTPPDTDTPAATPRKGKKNAASTIAEARTVLAKPSGNAAAALAAGQRTVEPQQQRQNHAGTDAVNRPASRNYAEEVDSREMADTSEKEVVVDAMAANTMQQFVMETIDERYFREFEAGAPIEFKDGSGNVVVKFEGQIAYEKFMQEPVVIRIHSTRDKNEARLVYLGVNGDIRWLERNVNYRLPRKFVERLLQAQEMAFTTKENPDPTVDNAMKLLKTLAASYEFSLIHDSNPVGRRWMKRMKREGS